MQRPLKRISQALASSLSVAMLAGCPNAGTAPPINPTGTATPATTGSPAATSSTAPGGATATTSPGTGSTGGASASPSGTATVNPAPTGATTILQGKIYNEEGATVDDATITVRSLDSRLAYNATATTDGGNYVVNNVPAGVQVEVTATREGWTRRTRVTSLQPDVSVRNVLNFGSASGADNEDVAGEAFFISDFPEISAATPGANPIAGDKLSYKVRFSEALDEDNRDRVENSFNIDTAAAPSDLVPDTVTGAELAARIEIEEGSEFLDSARRVTFTWNAENTEVTVAFDAPLRALGDEDKSYRFRLLRGTDSQPIEDADGNVLGQTEPEDPLESYFAVKKADLALPDDADTDDERWQATHQRSTSFDVAEDETDPTLVKVETTTENRDENGDTDFLRVDLYFSEAMRVYPDEKGYAQNVIDVENYVFAFAEDEGDLDGTDMDDTPEDWDPADATDGSDFADDVGQRPVRFAPVDDADADNTNDVFAEPSDDDPKVIHVYIPEAELPDNLKVIKVKVDTDVTDPAGNGVSESNEESETKTADNIAIGTI